MTVLCFNENRLNTHKDLIVKQGIQALLSQEMDRKKFLGFIGVVTLGVLGITTLLKNLSHAANKDTFASKPRNDNDSYGG